MRTATLTVTAGADGSAPPAEATVTPDKPCVVGRSRGADLVIDDDRVSRRHLVVEQADDAWVVRDVSSNGTWHDGSKIGADGVPVPPTGELRVHLGTPTGPEVVVAGSAPADADDQATALPAAAAGTAPRPAFEKTAERPVPGQRRADDEYAAQPVLAAQGLQAPGDRDRRPTAPGRRRGRRIGIIVVLIVVVLVAADRIAAAVASKAAVAQVVQQTQGLKSKPKVTFGGFPFLTQVAFGKYDDIGVSIGGITASGAPRIDHVKAHLKGAHIPFSKAIHNKLTKIPVDHITGDVSLTYADLNAFLKNQTGHLHLSQSGGALQVSGSGVVDGQSVVASGGGKLAVSNGSLTITPTGLKVSLPGGGALSDVAGGLSGVLGGVGGLGDVFPAVPVPLPNLPFHFRLTSVKVHGNGLEVGAAADKLVLDTQQS